MTTLQRRLQAVAPRAAELARRLPAHADRELLVKLRQDVDLDSFVSLQSQDGIQTVEHFQFPESMRARFGGELLRLKLPEGVTTAEGLALLEGDPRLSYVASNDLRQAGKVPSDELNGDLWGLERIQAPQAWERTTGSRQGPVIAVLDTGLDVSHPDIAPNLWTNPGEIPGNGIDDDGNGVVDDRHGYNAVDQTGDPFDDYTHGTHCAGTIAAVGDNGIGVTGVNWQARIMPVKMMRNGTGTVADTVRAVAYATANGATITSNSYGGPYSQPEYDAFAASPLLHICAAGNEGNDNDVSRYYPHERPVGYPATFELPNVISVAASGKNDRLANFSNYGAQTVDLAAPGVSVLSTVPGGGYETKSGTSMATPHVAGVAGLIATLYPDATPEQIKTRLLSNVDPVPALAGKVLTGGRLNAARALEDDSTPPSSPTQARAEARWNEIDLAWTHSADDGDAGGDVAFSEVRWTESDGRVVSHRQKGGASGSPAKTRLPLLPSADPRLLEVDLVQIDNVGNASLPARLQVSVPPARVADLDWVSDGKWARLDLPGRPGVWTDSPESNYGPREDSALTTRPFKLEGQGSLLSFETRYRIEPESDAVEVEILEAGGSQWKRLSELTSYREWHRQVVDLSPYDGKTVQLRFRLHSDSARSEEGIYLDRISVAGGAQEP
jgi:subtilisin family serine protease